MNVNMNMNVNERVENIVKKNSVYIMYI
jgi:hypothetical protein